MFSIIYHAGAAVTSWSQAWRPAPASCFIAMNIRQVISGT